MLEVLKSLLAPIFIRSAMDPPLVVAAQVVDQRSPRQKAKNAKELTLPIAKYFVYDSY